MGAGHFKDVPFYKETGFHVGRVCVDSYLDFNFEGKVFERSLFTSRIGLADQLFVLAPNKRTTLSVVTADVIHRWGVPRLGVKIDAVPGRMNSFTVKPLMPGWWQGQCYELCGVFHRLIPINVLVTRRSQDFEDYLVQLGRAP